MPLNKDEKEKIVSKFGENNTDTGSSSVQIALLTSRIRQLTEHVTIKRLEIFCYFSTMVHIKSGH